MNLKKWKCQVLIVLVALLFGLPLLIKHAQRSLNFVFYKSGSAHLTTRNESVQPRQAMIISQERETDSVDGKRFQINKYVATPNSSLVGKEFNFDNVTLDIVKNVLRTQTFKRKPVESIDAKKPFFDMVVPVTACSSNHYGEFKGHMEDFAKNFPGVKLYFYDLGLTESQADEIKTTPFLVYRKFNFDIYPKHVRHLTKYAWKPLIIQQMLAEFDGTMWLDSSVKFVGNQTHEIMDLMARYKTGIVFYLVSTGHSITAATHPGMTEYLPIEIETGGIKDMLQASAYIAINKEEVQKNLMKWLVICSLKEDCIAPSGSTLFCGYKFQPRNKFGGCHRYDQSLVNILASNTYNHQQYKYHYHSETFAVMNRG